MCCRIRQWLHDLELLDDRARPIRADDQWQRILVLGADMDEMDVEPIDLS
jgi:hypothetical protein